MALVTVTSLLAGTSYSLPHPLNILLAPGQSVTLDIPISELEQSKSLLAAKNAGYISLTVAANSALLPQQEEASVSEVNAVSAGAVVGPSSSVNNRVMAFNGTTGKLAKDSGVLYTDVATGPTSATSGNLPSFNGTGGKILQDSGVAAANLATLSGNNAFAGNVSETPQATLTPAGTTQTISWNSGNNAVLSLASATGDVTLTLSNPVTGATYTIQSTQGATARNLVWPNTVKWAFGVVPTVSTASGAVDLFVLYYNGTNYLGSFNQAYA